MPGFRRTDAQRIDVVAKALKESLRHDVDAAAICRFLITLRKYGYRIAVLQKVKP